MRTQRGVQLCSADQKYRAFGGLIDRTSPVSWQATTVTEISIGTIKIGEETLPIAQLSD